MKERRRRSQRLRQARTLTSSANPTLLPIRHAFARQNPLFSDGRGSPSARVDPPLQQIIVLRGQTTMPAAERKAVCSGTRAARRGHRCRQLRLILRPSFAKLQPTQFESCWSQGLAELQGKCSPLDDGRDLRRPDGPGPDVGQARVIRLAAVGFRASGAGTLALHDLCCALA